MLQEPFVWTEAVGCGEILPPFLDSFLAHHKQVIHVFGYRSDFRFYSNNNLSKNSQIVFIALDDSNSVELDSIKRIDISAEEIQDAYKLGHNGTAFIWSCLIRNCKRDFMIHLDADTVFLGDVISPLVEKLNEGYTIVGSRRPYRFRVSGGSILNKIQFAFKRDAVNTHCFGFNRSAIRLTGSKLNSYINGDSENKFVNLIFPVIDFFDRLTFHLSRNGAIYYLDSSDQRKSGKHDRFGDFEQKMISFSAVGSGCAYWNGKASATSETYRDFALQSFSLFSKYLLGKEVDYPILKSSYLLDKLELLDKSTWTLKIKK